MDDKTDRILKPTEITKICTVCKITEEETPYLKIWPSGVCSNCYVEYLLGELSKTHEEYANRMAELIQNSIKTQQGYLEKIAELEKALKEKK